MGKMQARENFVTYTEFGGKTQIVILMRQHDLECKFRKKKKKALYRPACPLYQSN